MEGYYSEKLSSERLRRVYALAPQRVKRYLEAEIRFVMERINNDHLVLEMGCGYGRVLEKLTQKTARVVGIDTSLPSLLMARQQGSQFFIDFLSVMNAAELGFRDKCFDTVICIQNGISAFHVDQEMLMREALRVTHTGGKVLFSSYSERFWPERLEWFRIQAEYGLLGEIDEQATGNGTIVCKDGFRATTVGPNEFKELASRVGITPKIVEVDGSSLFCEIDIE